MPLPQLAILLFGIGIALLLGDLLLPTHGILSILGGLGIVASVVVCYMIDFWLGTGVLLGTAILTPFVGAATVRMWPKTRRPFASGKPASPSASCDPWAPANSTGDGLKRSPNTA
jgi:membrane-bound ClpP family serine protease